MGLLSMWGGHSFRWILFLCYSLCSTTDCALGSMEYDRSEIHSPFVILVLSHHQFSLSTSFPRLLERENWGWTKYLLSNNTRVSDRWYICFAEEEKREGENAEGRQRIRNISASGLPFISRSVRVRREAPDLQSYGIIIDLHWNQVFWSRFATSRMHPCARTI